MNNPLNKSIFAETGCIDRHTLLNYKDGLLLRSDMHDVEKHLVDCELCSEALDGLRIMSDTVVLDEISLKLIGGHQARVPNRKPLRLLAMAASFTAIVLLSYFAVQQSKLASMNEQAMHQPAQSPSNKQAPETISNSPASSEISEMKDDVDAKTVTSQQYQLLEEDLEERTWKFPNREIGSNSNGESPSPMVENLESDDSKSLTTADEATDSHDRVELGSSSSGVTSYTQKDLSNPTDSKAVDLVIHSTQTAEMIAVAPKQKASRGSRAPGAVAPNAASNSNIMNDETLPVFKKQETNSLTPVDVHIQAYQNGRYDEALKGFENLLKDSPANETALFYKGMCLYRLQRFRDASEALSLAGKNRTTGFSDEALFHAALSYEKIGDRNEAMGLLNLLANGNGPFKQKAAKRIRYLDR